jgi:hypothetical protein
MPLLLGLLLFVLCFFCWTMNHDSNNLRDEIKRIRVLLEQMDRDRR